MLYPKSPLGSVTMAPPSRVAYWTALYGTYVNWLFTVLAAVFGTGAVSPILAPGRSGQAWQEGLVMAGFVSVFVRCSPPRCLFSGAFGPEHWSEPSEVFASSVCPAELKSLKHRPINIAVLPLRHFSILSIAIAASVSASGQMQCRELVIDGPPPGEGKSHNPPELAHLIVCCLPGSTPRTDRGSQYGSGNDQCFDTEV